MDWFRKRLVGAKALIRIIEWDEISDDPLVQLSMKTLTGEMSCFNEEVILMGFADSRPVVVPRYHDDYLDYDDDASTGIPRIVPG